MYVYTDHRRHGGHDERVPTRRTTLGAAPIQRPCCLLSPSFLIDPSTLGTHQGPDERLGVIYTGAAGFIDIGHVRHCCDTTKWVYDQIAALKGFPGSITTPEGKATTIGSIPASMWTSVARDIAFDEGLGHEIMTYWNYTPGMGNSSFSPEDLCSNHLGTYIAESAIKGLVPGSGLSFGAAVTAVLNATLTGLKAQPLVESQKAWARIGNCWIGPSVGSSLSRRNFSINPWKVGHSSDVATPAWLTQPPGAGAKYYTFAYSYTLTPINTSNFATRIQEVRANALKTYGPKYDQPSCP
jgi:hypothetical protein